MPQGAYARHAHGKILYILVPFFKGNILHKLVYKKDIDDILFLMSLSLYHKNSKNWDTLNYYRDCPTNGIVGFYSAILRSKDADRITNRVDTDQTAP